MKVIAQSTSKKFLVEATEDELVHLLGYYSNWRNSCPPIIIGLEIKVSDIFKQMYDLAKKRGEFKRIAESLRNLAGLLEVQSPIVEAVAEAINAELEAVENAKR